MFLDLQGKDKLTSLSWVDTTRYDFIEIRDLFIARSFFLQLVAPGLPQFGQVCARVCRRCYRIAEFLTEVVLSVDGVVKGTGSGLQKHIARDIAADQALKALADEDA